jgi:hypothetical protein
MTESIDQKSNSSRTPSRLRIGLATAAAATLLIGGGATGALAGGGGIGSSGDGGGGGDTSKSSGNRYAQEWDSFKVKDRKWARKTSECESGGDPNAYNPSGPYLGAFQFLRSTWKSAPMSKGKDPRKYNWKTQAVVAVKHMKRAGKNQWPVCG